MSPRTLRLLAAAYVVKAVLLGLLWLAAPDLAQRVWTRVRQAVTPTLDAGEAQFPTR